jgi:iron complex transport system substrate-binding protein
MRDFTYTARIILWLEDETTLADANFDGDVNVLDMTQIGLIILGRESKLTLVDSADRTVTVNKPVERVTFDHIATPEVISLLGAEDRAVGRDYYTTDEILLPWISNLPVIAGPMGYDVYYETVFELDPDIFFAVKLTYPGLEDVIATLEPEIPVVVLNFFEPDTMVENIRKMRYVLNTEENGEEFIAWYEGVIYSIEEKTTGLSEEEKPQVFLKVPGWTHEELATYSDESAWARYLIGISGGINIAANLPGEWVAVDSEWLVDQNPDTVVASMYAPYNPSASGYDVDDTSVAEATRDEIMAMDVFAGGKAVEEGRVYLFQIEMSATPRFVVTQAYMAKWFQPELFEDLDPKAIHQEYLTDFMRIDYDLDEHGVFVYPEEPVES